MARRKLHTAGALAGLATLTAGTLGLGGTAVAAPAAADTTTIEVSSAVMGAQVGLSLGGRAQGARLAEFAPQAATARAGAAHGTTVAPAQDRRQIRHAVKRSPLTSAVDPDDYRVRDIRLSRTHPAWAAAMIRPTIPLDDATVLAHRVHGHWTVVTLGTAQVGCDAAPAAVLKDFRGYESMGHCS